MTKPALGTHISSFIPTNAQVLEEKVTAVPDFPQGQMHIRKLDRTGDGNADALHVVSTYPNRTTTSVHLLDADGQGRVDVKDRNGDGAIDSFTVGREGPAGFQSETQRRLPKNDEVVINRPAEESDGSAKFFKRGDETTVGNGTSSDGRPQKITETIRRSGHEPRDRIRFDQVIPGGVTGFLIARALEQN